MCITRQTLYFPPHLLGFHLTFGQFIGQGKSAEPVVDADNAVCLEH
jgi:hypothetical protein